MQPCTRLPRLLPELTDEGLLLWRLRWSPDHQLWCLVAESSGELAVRVHDPATGRTTTAGVYANIASTIDRAEALRIQFIAAGWQIVDVDLDEPD